MKKTIIKEIRVEVTICDVCREEPQPTEGLNRLTVGWAKDGVGKHSESYEICDLCWLGFQMLRDVWIAHVDKPISHSDGVKEANVLDGLRLMEKQFKQPYKLEPVKHIDHNVDASTWK